MAFQTYYAYAGAAHLLLELFHFCRQRKLYDYRTKLLLVMLTDALLICLCSIEMTQQINTGRVTWSLTELIAVVNYFTQFAMPYLLLCMSCLIVRKPHHLLVKIGTVFWVCGSFAILSNPWSNMLAYADEDNLWHVGAGYPVFVWSIFTFYLLDLCIVRYQRKSMKQRYALVEACIIMIGGILLQNILHARLVAGFSAALAMAVIYLSIQNPYAYIDFTTQVFNADYFNYCLWECSYYKRPVFLWIVHLSELERIRRLHENDTEVSLQVAKQLWEITSKHRVFRVESDKYALFSSSAEEHYCTLKQVQKLFSQGIDMEGQSMQCPAVLVSLEHAETVCHGSIAELTNYVRFLLRQAKRDNGVQLVHATLQLHERFVYERKIEQYLTDAIEQDLFEVWYQPIWSVTEQKFVSLEALSRLHHPEFGWVNPELFIQLAVKNGKIFTLMPYQLRKICRFLQMHSADLPDIKTVKINLSPVEFTKEGYCEQLIEIIRSYDIPMNLIQFEVTETNATEYTKELEHCIQILQENEIRLCLDDFGSGYANLSNILRLPFSVIKMDRSLLQGICTNKNAAVFYHNMVDTLHGMGYQIISEGVETKQEAKLLKDWNVDMIQGYYYAKPQPASAIRATCKNKSD